MIRIRRLPPRLLRRRLYEVEFTDDADGAHTWTRVTPTPITIIDRYIGTGDAWSLVSAADEAWDGELGEWVSL